MTEEQRRRAAAQRCADLANELSMRRPYVANEFLNGGAKDLAFLNAVLQLDELARIVASDERPGSKTRAFARQHILPEPKLSPVDRFREACRMAGISRNLTDDLLLHLEASKVTVAEVDPSDDQ